MSIRLRYLLVFTFLLALNVNAGSQQSVPPKHKPENIISFAKQVERYAAKHHARAFVISRLGQPAKNLPKGIDFTHTAIAVYSSITLSDGSQVPGYAIYNLYQKESNPKRSEIIMDYPVDFFWGVHELKAGILIPSEDLQTRLIEAIQLGFHTRLHNPKYSLISNPFNNKYQNCTEHTLNVLNAAIYQTDDMRAIKATVKRHFEPYRLKVSPVKLALGSLFSDGVRTSDHGSKTYTTTFTSIVDYLKTNDLVNQVTRLHFKEDNNSGHRLAD